MLSQRLGHFLRTDKIVLTLVEDDKILVIECIVMSVALILLQMSKFRNGEIFLRKTDNS